MQKRFKYGVFQDLDATAVELPYKDSDISMMVILPNSKTGLPALESKLNTINLSELSQNMYSEEVNVEIPKFKIEFSIELNDPLKKVNICESEHSMIFFDVSRPSVLIICKCLVSLPKIFFIKFHCVRL